MKKLVFVAAASLLILSGCAQFRPQGFDGGVSAQDFATWCEKRVHCVNVTIENGGIVVKPDPVRVPGPRNQIHWIVWHIATPGYIFVNEAGDRPIVFKIANTQFNPEDPNNGCFHYFDNVIPANGKNFLCVNRNTLSGPFAYKIKVTAMAGMPAVPILDPVVFNDP